MDLFPKDYKKNNPLSGGPVSSGAGFLGGLKNRISLGGGNLSLPSRVSETLLRLGSIVSVLALAVVLLGWGGLYFYKRSLAGQIDSLKKQQADIFSTQDKAAAEKLVKLDKNSSLAQTLFKNHVYSSEIFSQLATSTLPRVQWQSLDLSVKDSSLVLKGFSADYATLAKQLLALSEGGFSNVKVTNIALDKSGGVSFIASFNFDLKIIQR